MWAKLVHSNFWYVPAVSNVVTNGSCTGTKNVLKWNLALGFEFSIKSSVYGATTSESKLIVYLYNVYCKFLLYVSIEIDPFSCEQNWHFSTQTKFQYLGLVNVSVLSETYCS